MSKNGFSFAMIHFIMLLATFLLLSPSVQSQVKDISLSFDLFGDEVYSGEELLITTEVILIRQPGETDSKDVTVSYALLDRNGMRLNHLTVTKAALSRLTSTSFMQIPLETPPGTYTLTATAAQGSAVARISKNLVVLSPPATIAAPFIPASPLSEYTLPVVILFIGLFLSLIWIFIQHRNIKKISVKLVEEEDFHPLIMRK